MAFRRSLALLAGWLVAPACRPSGEGSETQAQISARALREMVSRVDEGVEDLEHTPLEFRPDSGDAGMSLAGGNSFQTTMDRLGKLWDRARANPCELWAPLFRNGGTGINRPYFFVGMSAEAGAGFHGVVGRDFVWDFYNLQFASFRYVAAEVVLGSGTAGAGVNGYLGLGFGVRPDVNAAWSGKFLSTGLAASLPVLADYLSATATGFVAADSNGNADWSFLGGSLGVSLALSVPVGVPGALQTAAGEWFIEPEINKTVAGMWKGKGLPVSSSGAATCGGSCVRFDTKKSPASYTERAVTLARSVPLLASAPGQEMLSSNFDKILLMALATGAFRDTANASQACSRGAPPSAPPSAPQAELSPDSCARMNSIENPRTALPTWCPNNGFARGVSKGFCARTTRNAAWVKGAIPQYSDEWMGHSVGGAGNREKSVRVWVTDRKVHNAGDDSKPHLIAVKVRHIDSSLKNSYPETWMLPGYLEKSDDCGGRPSDL